MDIHIYANSVKAQIDFILINKKWINNSNSFSTVSSDHRIVTASIRLSLRANKLKTSTTPRYDWSVLRDDNNANRFNISLSSPIE